MIEYVAQYGGRSSMAEHLTVDQVVEGSSPFAHPYIESQPKGWLSCFLSLWNDCLPRIMSPVTKDIDSIFNSYFLITNIFLTLIT
jgi:hypothetical protein